MRLATWNINSIRTRQARLLGFLNRHRPDVLCLQELRAPADEFPHLAIRAAGYHAVAHAQAARNGVAVLALEPPEVRHRGFAGGIPAAGIAAGARLLDVSVAGARVLSAYVPNGKAATHPDWPGKLEWLGALRAHLDATADPAEPLALCGDFNVAPLDRDVSAPDPAGVLCHPDARRALERVAAWGLEDAYRRVWPPGEEPEKGIYTWWDYTRLSFARNVGARIDHVYLTPALAAGLERVFVDRDERRQKKGQDIPSDHAPVVCDLRDPSPVGPA